jgi:copper chaperone
MTTILRSPDLTCPSCVLKIETALKHVDGVQHAAVHFTTGRIEVQHDPARVTVDDLVKTMRATGYQTTAGTR